MKRYLCILLFGALLCTICSNVKVKANENKEEFIIKDNSTKSTGVGFGVLANEKNITARIMLPCPIGYNGDGSDYHILYRYEIVNTSTGIRRYAYNDAPTFRRYENWLVYNFSMNLDWTTSGGVYYPSDQVVKFGIVTSDQVYLELIETLGDNIDNVYFGLQQSDYSLLEWENIKSEIRYDDISTFGPIFIIFKNAPDNYVLKYPEINQRLATYPMYQWVDPSTINNNVSGGTVEVQPLESHRTGLIDQIGSIFGSYTPYSHGVDFQVVFGYGLILLLVYFCGRMIITLLNK